MNGPSLISSTQEPVGRSLLNYGMEITEIQGSRSEDLRLDRGYVYAIAKRGFDVLFSFVMLFVLAPVLLVTAILIKFRDNGPILFIQKRIGKDGRLFDFYKFRSMVVGAERMKAELLSQNDHKDSLTFKMRKDPRITWIGRIIRRTSIDEIPQLFNILWGDMTLVGPRPAVPSEVDQYSDFERRRLDVTPGLTCFWQVSGRADIPFKEQVAMDIQYIEQQSFLLDLQILARTVPAVLSGRGAY